MRLPGMRDLVACLSAPSCAFGRNAGGDADDAAQSAFLPEPDGGDAQRNGLAIHLQGAKAQQYSPFGIALGADARDRRNQLFDITGDLPLKKFTGVGAFDQKELFVGKCCEVGSGR